MAIQDNAINNLLNNFNPLENSNIGITHIRGYGDDQLGNIDLNNMVDEVAVSWGPAGGRAIDISSPVELVITAPNSVGIVFLVGENSLGEAIDIVQIARVAPAAGEIERRIQINSWVISA